MRQSSLVLSIKLALSGIVALASVTMVLSYWISDSADTDAYAINLAGSLRMQTYRLALLEENAQASAQMLAEARAKLIDTWSHPLVQSFHEQQPSTDDAWPAPWLAWSAPARGAIPARVPPLATLDQQVAQLDQLVQRIQAHTEANAQRLRLVQVTALFSILALAAIVTYWLRIRLELPLRELVQISRRIGQRDFDQRIQPARADELGSLALTINKMSDSIAHMHREMEHRISDQTEALQRSNTTLQFLYDTAKMIIEKEPGSVDYQPILDQLQSLVNAEDLELCLITDAGDTPYRQVKPAASDQDLCSKRNCEHCLEGMPLADDQTQVNNVCRYSFPMHIEHQHYGVLVARMAKGHPPAPWQRLLLQSVADQIAMALSLQVQEDNARRLSLAHERTVIARELHDSLAQALSYLKIQVTRLNRALAKDDKAVLEDVSNELQQGLSSAYRQLRELLTTFRLKVDGPGIVGALQSSAQQFREQSDMHIELDYRLEHVPLTPNEEVHLLQIVREATQNAIHHSNGTRVGICIELRQQQVLVSIVDNGVGIAEQPHKVNHYGLAIMQERSKHLGGELSIANRAEGGTGVYFTFTPHCLMQPQVIARQG